MQRRAICRAGWCPICREEADIPRHILSRCPALMGTGLSLLGCINPNMEDLRSDGVVTSLVAAARSLQSRSATLAGWRDYNKNNNSPEPREYLPPP